MSEMGTQSARDGRMAYGCFLCRSGIEERIIAELRISAPELYVISPKKIRIRRMGSEAHEEQVTLFPGYVFFRADGAVGLSKAYYEGDRIRVTEGALKRYEASITRVNHRAKTAEVRVDFHGKVMTIWLGFELIEPAGKDI